MPELPDLPDDPEYDGPWLAMFDRFRDEFEAVPDDAVPVATLSVMWWISRDGGEFMVSKLDGQQRVAVTVGDLSALIHAMLEAQAVAGAS